uniref:Calponin-homology (CH) domain-containing protein n=1 Tax=Parastrongyloides trichosuri TaxID=131310 RepID=A0A0N4ZZ80_PARTI
MAAVESVSAPNVETVTTTDNKETNNVTEKIQETVTATADGVQEVAEGVTTGVEETKAAVDEAIAQLKTLQEDPIAWISAQKPAAIHKVNSMICNWIAALVNEGTETPTVTVPGKNDNVTKNQFLTFLKDGTVLAQLANKLSPGFIENVHEGENAQVKENQTSNIEGFIKFVKEKIELAEDQVFSVADIQEKGKEGYQAVFNTLTRVGMSVKDKFEKDGLDIDSITESAAKVAQNKIFVTLLGLFNRAKAALTAKKSVSEKSDKQGGEGTTEEGDTKKEDGGEETKNEDGTAEPNKDVSE